MGMPANTVPYDNFGGAGHRTSAKPEGILHGLLDEIREITVGMENDVRQLGVVADTLGLDHYAKTDAGRTEPAPGDSVTVLDHYRATIIRMRAAMTALRNEAERFNRLVSS